ncbi:L-idonate 5-dehydrogenase [Roseicella aerolata]|uniref:L-idonate 5-dehydrogenase n=1 Tax=Roseicella aerolata TaxID=2883479 RepID=A0A9X1IAN0_9PROT|nr:L-idonate 5-dehydrogenase [Roseicella aerolata]MCB4821037.1 L-idonate 5-dehydrogenase [Roseicella aerolata]
MPSDGQGAERRGELNRPAGGRAVVIHAPKDLRIEERAAAEPGPGQVRLRIRAGGICGSDLHYYLHGGFGAVRLREPMVLGHEIAGTVEAVGEGVAHLAPGISVAVNPSLPCGACRWCLAGQPNHCLDMRFYGSAMRLPHVQGGFAQSLVCEAARAVPLPDGMDIARAAFAEPLSVCLHAARQAGPLLGARVLVTGAGPIGTLAVAVARHAGAREIVVTDLLSSPLLTVRRMGADRTVAVAEDPEALRGYAVDKGHFDVVFEASGSAAALKTAIEVARPGAVIVQLGLGGDVSLPLSALVAKEIALRGTFRFQEEFALAIELLARGAIDPMPMLTATLPVEEAVAAFELAGDRSKAMKVQLAF